MAKVQTLPGVVRSIPLAAGEASSVVVARLEEMLKRARRGEFQRLVYATAGHGGIDVDWCGEGFWDQAFAAAGDLHHALAQARQDERLSKGNDIV